MKVAVITPYHTEPLEMLKRAHDSVAAQTHACTHYMVADGHARAEIESWDVRHIALPVAHHNNGNTPRAIGSLDAIGDGFDAIAYLDADNWFEPEHIASLVECHLETGADIVSSGRVIHAIDGTVLLPGGESDDGTEISDTSTMLFARPTFGLLPLWGTMPRELGPNCDRFIFKGLQSLGCTYKHSPSATVHFTSRYGPHYKAAGRAIPPEATAMHAMKESDQFTRRLRAQGLNHVLSGRDVEQWFSHKKTEPYIVIFISDEDTLTPDQKALNDGLEIAFAGKIEIYFSTARDALNETSITDQHNNVFVFYFEGVGDDRVEIEELAENRGDMAVIYCRPNTKSAADVDTVLDRRAWKIVVEDEHALPHYAANCRYGAGHVIVSRLATAQEELAPLIKSYAR